MKKSGRSQSPKARTAAIRNWAWCRITSARAHLQNIATDNDNVMLPSEKAAIQAAADLLAKFLETNDNSANWEKKKQLTEAAAKRIAESEEY